jgi:WD40 repeat protein
MVSSKQPPGDSTKFYVTIEDLPIAGALGSIDLIVHIFSVELGGDDPIQGLKLRLFVEGGARFSFLELNLPVKKFQVKPGEQCHVPVGVHNLNQQSVNVVLSFLGVESSWLINGTEQRFKLEPDEQKQVTFSCQPPSAIAQAPSEIYPFTIEATHDRGAVVSEQGTIEVLRQGFVYFRCTPQRHTIPARGRGLRSGESDSVNYNLEFQNESNSSSSVSIKLDGKDLQKLNLKVPSPINLTPGETSTASLIAGQQQHRWGLTQKLRFQVIAESDRNIDLRNDTHTLELRIRPIIPLWLQILGLLGPPVLLVLWYLIFGTGHKGSVYSVRLSGLADRVISGSEDQTMRDWSVSGKSLKPLKELAQVGKAVRVVRYKPVNNDIVAAGLENGEIQLWDVLGSHKKPITSFVNQKDDRVLALEFTKNSRYLFSGHGSGWVLRWDIEGKESGRSAARNKPVARHKSDFAVYALAVVVGKNKEYLAIAGRYNKLELWNFASKSKKARALPYPRPGAQDDYIESLTVAANKPNLMATADTQGYITLWDMDKCLVKDVKKEECVLDEWDKGHEGKPVRSLSLSKDGCYLASAGDDGRVILWPLTREGKRQLELSDGTPIHRNWSRPKINIDWSRPKININWSRSKINDVALILRENDILLVTGSADHRVRLHSAPKSNTNCADSG